MNFPSQATFFRWMPACWLRVAGTDAATFLQGQFTNDLRGLRSGDARYGLWLNVKGKVVADSFVVGGRSTDEFWIGSYFSPAAVIQNRLEAYVIADDVTFEDQTNDWAAMTLFGVSETQRPIFAETIEAGFTIESRRAPSSAIDWIYPNTAAAKALATVVQANEIDANEAVRLRIESAIPAIPQDIGASDLPNEGGLDVDAISYSKGCYLGQEVMARLKTLGQVRRRLLEVRAATEVLPSLPAPLYIGNRVVGELRSAVISQDGLSGLAMLTLMHVAGHPMLSLAPDTAPMVRIKEAV